MSNTLTGLVSTLYSAAQTVAREATGFIGAVDTRFDDKGAAVNQTIRVPIAPAQAGDNYAPGPYVATGTDRVVSYTDVSISKSRFSSFNLTGEEERSLSSGGNDSARILFEQSVSQCMRTLMNEVEADLGDIYKYGSRAYGSAGNTPFVSSVADASNINKILTDNGAPNIDRSLIINTTAGVNLRNLGAYSKANEGGQTDTLRRGVLVDLFGLNIRESAQVKNHTAGTGTAYQANNVAGLVANSTTLAVDAGNGTCLAGDVISFTGDTYKYVVNTALSAGSLAIGKPGIRSAIADDIGMSISDGYAANVAFYKGAVVLVARPPMIESTPIIETMPVTDPVTGLTFLMVRAMQDGQVTYRVHLAWGYKVVQPEYVAVLIG